jgi:crotonobetainyl-CoA:carnitine CoA-transferase CaiB-like acyl-CoA transferase
MSEERQPPSSALQGVRVLELANLYAGPLIGTNLADFGADVIKAEHPRGDDARRWGLSKDGVPLWWKSIARNKRLIKLDLNEERDRATARKLAQWADVLIESFRPGRMEQWGLGYDELAKDNPRLIMVRVSGFGQTGPYRDRPGFGTLAEAFSGFAHITGTEDGPPTLPPFGLADGVAALAGTFATLIALYWRDAQGGHHGQVVDLSLYEPLFSILGPQITEYKALGVVQNRLGNRSPRTVPRNAYRTSDGGWVVLSAGTQQIANRIFEVIGRPEMARDPRFATAEARRAHAGQIDEVVEAWIADRPLRVVLDAFEKNEAPVAPVMHVAQIANDEQYLYRRSFVDLEDEDLGYVTVPNIVPRLNRTPGTIRWAGKVPVGSDSAEILAMLGLDNVDAREVGGSQGGPPPGAEDRATYD